MKLDVAARCSREILANWLMSIDAIARWRTKAGRTSSTASEIDVRRYAFGIILNNPNIQPLIRGSDVLEIGPGDHLATGLSFLAYGAKSYTALDRFPGNYRGHAAMRWYALVHSAWHAHFNSEWPGGLDAFPDLPNVSTLAASIEEEAKLPSNAFDLIVSEAVGEHVGNVELFARGTYKMLKPGGVAMHNVDFSCHGFFQNDPLYFLTIPEPIWKLMGSNRGIPNRVRFHQFLHCFEKENFTDIQIAGRSMTSSSIPASLRGMDRDSLLTKWASFILTK